MELSTRFPEAAAALESLPADEHAWCRVPELAQIVAVALISPDTSNAAQGVWHRVAQELSCCPTCIVAHHQAQVSDWCLLDHFA